MKCPRCGCTRAKYEVPAGYKKIPKEKIWERKIHTASCPKCGFHYNAETGEEIKEKKKKVVEMPSPEIVNPMADDRENMTEGELEEAEYQIERACMAEGH